MPQHKTYRIIVSYSGFEENKDLQIIRASRQDPAQTTYDPVETRRSIDFTFRSHKTATNARTRIAALRAKTTGFSISKVIDDSY